MSNTIYRLFSCICESPAWGNGCMDFPKFYISSKCNSFEQFPDVGTEMNYRIRSLPTNVPMHFKAYYMCGVLQSILMCGVDMNNVH